MKLKIFSLLIAVLMSTAVLASCSKAPAGAESNSGNSDNLSTEQDGEPSVSESGAESGESGAQSGEEAEDENFDYTGWQDFSYEMNALTCEIYYVEGEQMFSGTSPLYPMVVNFKLPVDFKILYDVYGGEFHAGTKFDFYPLNFFIVSDEEIESVRKTIMNSYGGENIALPHGIYIIPDDFSEPWYDYLVVKEARGDPDWMCAYHYYIYAEIDGGILKTAVNEYGAFDENYDMSNAIDFIKQVMKTVSVTIDYDSQS